ncbi:MAG: hypothetical protein ACKOTB_05100 [Planctomycetia bacterium]
MHVFQGFFRVAAFVAAVTVSLLVVRAEEAGVRIRFGLTDEGPTDWSGTGEVSPGSVTHIGGWRFAKGDSVDGVKGWTTKTRPLGQRGRGNNANKAAERAAGRQAVAAQKPADNGVVVSMTGVTEASKFTVRTPRGEFTVALGDLPYGEIKDVLDGAVEVERTAAASPLTTRRTDEAHPAVAVAPDGTTHVAYVEFTHGDRSAYRGLEAAEAVGANANAGRGWKVVPGDMQFLAAPVGGDRVMLRSGGPGGFGEPVEVSPGGGDIYKCGVTVDGRGTPWVVWSQNTTYPSTEPNFEIIVRPIVDGKPAAAVTLSENPGSDLNPAVATAADGRVWCVWQGVRDGVFCILERHQAADGSWTPARVVSTQARNCWTPAIAAASSGMVAVAWDTYDKGDYDVWLREFPGDGEPSQPLAVADTADYEARPALTFDREGGLWIAYEMGSPSWGKDSGPYDNGGNPLYKGRQIGLVVRKGGAWMEPAQSHLAALPHPAARRGVKNQRVAPVEPGGESPAQSRAAELGRDLAYNNLARITCDRAGNVWLLCRSRQNDFRVPLVGSLWLSWALVYDGEAWSGPILIPNSDNLLYNTPGAAALPAGGIVVAHSSDHRQDRFGLIDDGAPTVGGASDPFDNDVFVTWLESAGSAAGRMHLVAAKHPPRGVGEPTAATVAEQAAVDRCRSQWITVDGRGLRLIRGEYHRHTEISGDGGNDGPLEDMWRYALDVAQMDWLGSGDHDNGAGREYTWWLTQKTTDAFRIAGRFEPPFTYERSVPYPEGHRNVMFAKRGVRTLPRLPKLDRSAEGSAPDTRMLYRYLHQFQGVCAVHTSATSMGTDWRDNDPVVEPMVEIYQGDRQNYERPGAPRCPTADYSIGGWEPLGFVNLALLKGYKLAFQCSSDHLSTHISYANVYAEDLSREALLAAIRERHIYGSTDNIVAEFTAEGGGRQHMLGDAFRTDAPPRMRIRLHGTAPWAKVTLVKDDVEVPLPCGPSAEFDHTWTDTAAVAGKESYYYVRGEQADGELVWVSPMWITYAPPPAP